MTGFVKIYASILDSSIWAEDHATRLVWITVLAMADADGMVSASVTGVARRANVSVEECQRAIAKLTGPDPESRDETTGERLHKVKGGWVIVNHRRYRDMRTESQLRDAARARRYRKRDASRDDRDASRTPTDIRAEAEAEAEAEYDDGDARCTRLSTRPADGTPPVDLRHGLRRIACRGGA